MSSIEQADVGVAKPPGRRAKGANLVFLNVAKLDALKTRPGESRTEYWDRGVRGFGVRVYANGRKAFNVRYVLHGEQLRRVIGVYRNERGIVGGEIGYSQARAEAERIISEARHGRDPFMAEALLRDADISTVDGLCARFLADPAPGRSGRVYANATRVGITRIVEKELVPAWGHRDPNSIQRAEIRVWAKGIAEGKGRKRPAPYLANRAVDYMAMIYSWAVRREILRYTPFLGLEKPFAEQPRTRSFGNDELRRLFAALAKAPKQIAAVWLMLFYTATRLRESLRMEWAWIDFEKKYLVVPAAVTKNKRPHLVPLVQPAIELLEAVKALAPDSPYVFPGPNGKPLNWIQRMCTNVMNAAGIEDGRHHDTRRVVQTNMAELGVAPHVADMILNHAVKGAPRSRAHYDMYHYIPEKQDALTRWARWVQRLTEILGHDPNEIMKAVRTGFQGKGPARRLGKRGSYNARLASHVRDLAEAAAGGEDPRATRPSAMSSGSRENSRPLDRPASRQPRDRGAGGQKRSEA